MNEIAGAPDMIGPRLVDIGPERCTAILKVLDAGWQQASAATTVHSGASEVDITERLRTGMRHALGTWSAPWQKEVTILPGTESPSQSGAAKPVGLTDIPIFFRQLREEFDAHDPHAIIECKRVAGDNARLCRLYVTEGIDRFKTGKYAGNQAVGFMAGYLLSGDAASAAAAINRYLTRQQRQPEHLEPCTVLNEPWTRSSRHPRPDPAEPITLHHALLGLRAAAP